ncbi:hypothetical protein CK203_039664 [Vitis vinifera]|uniref:Integrase catalytic domain-containing protein n=1 Tax=Vitis vinifera TaxID=29760 RepID=A0A438HFL6_VITVI|nr:hypothetical protein CK203_039664 [Vitis vinifera]
MNCDPSSWQYEKPVRTGGRTAARALSKKIKHYLINKVLKDGANGFGPSKCCPEAPPLLLSSPGGRAHRSAPSQHPTQTGPDRKNASMGHRVEQEPRGEEWWTLRVDGASWSLGSEVGLLLQSPIGEQLRVYSDFQLVVRHVQKEYEAKDECMARYLNKASTCNTIEASQADGQEWTEAIIKYLRTGTLPEEPRQAHKTRVQAAHFTLIGGHLYKRNHSGGRYLAHRAHSQGYYWPTMKKDVATHVKKCDKCQRHAPIPHDPYQLQLPRRNSCSSPQIISVNGWKLKHTLASKTKTSPSSYGRTSSAALERIPQTIIADNGPQFDSIIFRNFCSELNIRNLYSTPRYPQSNGQVEATNKTLITALKEEARTSQREVGRRATRRPMGLSNHTRMATGNTPFALVYGMDAVILTEIELPTIQTEAGRQDDANVELGRNLN